MVKKETDINLLQPRNICKNIKIEGTTRAKKKNGYNYERSEINELSLKYRKE